MRIAIPHNLGREEVRRRLHDRLPEVSQIIPGGLAEVEAGWANEDRATLLIRAMMQEVSGSIDIEDAQIVFTVNLPPALSFVEPAIRGAIEDKGRKLLT
jgi:hypothetical protein